MKKVVCLVSSSLQAGADQVHWWATITLKKWGTHRNKAAEYGAEDVKREHAKKEEHRRD